MQLQQKSFKELTEIGWQLNVLPTGDRRCRQNWIKAISSVSGGSLTFLEVSLAASVEQVQAPIIETVKPVPEAPPESKAGCIVYPRSVHGAIVTPKFKVGDLVQSKTMLWGIDKKSMVGTVLELLPRGGVRIQFGNHISGYGGTFDFSKSQLEDLINMDQIQEPSVPIDENINTRQLQEPIQIQAQEPIAPIDENINTLQRQELMVALPRMPRPGDALLGGSN